MQIWRNLVAILEAGEMQVRQTIASFPIGLIGNHPVKAADLHRYVRRSALIRVLGDSASALRSGHE